MATSLVLRRLTSEIPTTITVNKGRVTAYGTHLVDHIDYTKVVFNSHSLKPFNVRGNASVEDGQVTMWGKRTSLELIPNISGNLDKITIRRGVSLPISIT